MCPESSMELGSLMSPNPKMFWSYLLDKIEDGRVIPVIGPNLIEVVLDDVVSPLEDHVARRLALSLDLESTKALLSGARLLFDVVARAHRKDDKKEYHIEVNRLLKEFRCPAVPSALSSLARITDFNLYLSLGFDNLLQRALGEERVFSNSNASFLAYAPQQRQGIDLPKPLADLDEPLVYGLFGKSCPAPEFVISEEDQLEWVTALQDHSTQPPLLFDALRTSHLLFIGCDLPDWLMRFFIRFTRESRISRSRANETLVGPQSHDHSQLVSFLDRFSPNTLVLDMAPQEFVAELEARWQERRVASDACNNKGSALPADIRSGGVFLSYASEDFAAVEVLHQALQDRQIDTWFDDSRLTSGVRYDEVIERNISRCGVILPVLSAATLSRLRKWRDVHGCRPDEKPYFLKEWELALARQKLQPGTLAIMPVRIDELVDLHDSMIPADLRAVTCEYSPAGQANPGFIDAVKQGVREKRILRRVVA